MKKENIRYVIAAIALLYIIYMWTTKNVSISDFSLPMVLTSFVVTLFKVLILAGIIYIVKTLLNKRK